MQAACVCSAVARAPNQWVVGLPQPARHAPKHAQDAVRTQHASLQQLFHPTPPTRAPQQSHNQEHDKAQGDCGGGLGQQGCSRWADGQAGGGTFVSVLGSMWLRGPLPHQFAFTARLPAVQTQLLEQNSQSQPPSLESRKAKETMASWKRKKRTKMIQKLFLRKNSNCMIGGGGRQKERAVGEAGTAGKGRCLCGALLCEGGCHTLLMGDVQGALRPSRPACLPPPGTWLQTR